MEITNPELKALDKRVAKFYEIVTRYSNNLPNLYGREVYKRELSNILRVSERIKPESEFDKLLLRNIESNLRRHDLVIDYFTNQQFSLSPDEFIDETAGKGSWEYIEQITSNPPGESIWNHDELRQKRAAFRVGPFSDESKEAAKSLIPEIKRNILEYGKSEGYLPQDFDTRILLLPPTESGEGHSSWQLETKIFELSSFCFDFVQRDEKIIAIPTKAYETAFHEILGHAAHQIYSSNMPHSLRFTRNINSLTPSNITIEAISTGRGKDCFGYLRERLEELNITEEDIHFVEEDDKIFQQSQGERVYVTLIKDRELREEGFNGYKHILEKTNNLFTAESFKRFNKGFINAWSDLGYVAGRMYYQRMLDKVKEEFGSEFLEKERKRIHKAAATGVWSWEVYPEAVCYILKNS